MFILKDNNPRMYEIAAEYRDFLRRYDKKVSTKSGRKFYGILVSNKSNDYFIPFTRQIHKNTKSDLCVNIYDSNKTLIAKLLLNNMIPVNSFDAQLVDFGISKFKTFYQNEIRYLRTKETKSEVVQKIDKMYTCRMNRNCPQHEFYSQICCDFQLLEEKCIEWAKIKNVLPNVPNLTFDDLVNVYDKLGDKSQFEILALRLDKQNKL